MTSYAQTIQKIEIKGNEIADKIIQLKKMVTENIKTKFVFSSIAPRNDKKELHVKAQLVNALVASRLPNTADITICHNENLFTRGIFEPLNYEDDVHLNKKKGLLHTSSKCTFCYLQSPEKRVCPTFEKQRQIRDSAHHRV